jgi:hypothetical protein
MNGNKNGPNRDELSSPNNEELNRLLMAQLYETSVRRYGADSDQVRTLSRLRSPAGLDRSKKKTN